MLFKITKKMNNWEDESAYPIDMLKYEAWHDGLEKNEDYSEETNKREKALLCFIETQIKEAERRGSENTLEVIASGEGWEESEEHYKKILKLNQ